MDVLQPAGEIKRGERKALTRESLGMGGDGRKEEEHPEQQVV